jgi:hypothetical protein
VLEPREVRRAQVGPRELKDPRSKAYAIQTLYALKRYAESLRCDQERVAKELAEIERYRHWEVLGYPSKDALLQAELSAKGLANVDRVKDALETAPTPVGQGRRTDLQLLNNIKKLAGTHRDYLAARLRRDHPDICARIEAGEFKSVRAAAIAAGIIKVQTPLDQLRHWWQKASAEERVMFLKDC